MKKPGSVIEFTLQRNADILRAFRSVIARATRIDMHSVCRQIAVSPSARFWVSEERAAVVISHMLAGRSIASMSPNKQLMFREIFRRVSALRAADPTAPLNHLISTVIHQPAPAFYLSPRSIAEFIYRSRNGYYSRPKKSKIISRPRRHFFFFSFH